MNSLPVHIAEGIFLGGVALAALSGIFGLLCMGSIELIDWIDLKKRQHAYKREQTAKRVAREARNA